MFEKFGRSIPQSLVDAVSLLMSEAKADEPAAPDADAIARRKRLQALKDKQEDDAAERGTGEKKSSVRTVAGNAYGGAKQKDDIEEEVEHVDEVLTKKTPLKTWIHDFVHSKNSKFSGKSAKERSKMAQGAYYGKQEESAETDDTHFSKQSKPMQDAINLHLRKGKSYKEACAAAKVHVKEESEIEESRGHKIIANKLAQIDRMSSGVAPDHSTNVQSTKDKLKDAANIKKVEIVNQKDTSVKEDKDTVTKDASGKVTSWSHEGDWKKSTGKEGRGKSVHLSDLARRKSEKLAKEEIEPIEELSKKTLASYAKKASSSSDERSASNLASKAGYKSGASDEAETYGNKSYMNDYKDDTGEKEDKKSFQRSKGIGRAIDRLAKEEKEKVEPTLGISIHDPEFKKRRDDEKKKDQSPKTVVKDGKRIYETEELDERQITQGSGSSPDPLVARIGILRTIKNANGKSKPYEIERGKSHLKTAIKSTLDNKEHGKSKLPEEVELDETATLDQYIKSLGYDPLNMEKNKKVMYSKTNAFKSYASRSEGASPGQDVDTSINPNASARG